MFVESGACDLAEVVLVCEAHDCRFVDLEVAIVDLLARLVVRRGARHLVCVVLFEDDEGLWNDRVRMICRIQDVGELRRCEFAGDEWNELVGLARVSIEWVVVEIECDDMLVLVIASVHL